MLNYAAPQRRPDHCNLERPVDEGGFREDLYYRIQVIHIEMPALRGHTEDILELALHFLRCAAARSGRAPKRLTREAAETLCRHEFPGNVRELENAMERVDAVGRYDHALAEDLPEAMRLGGPHLTLAESLLTVEQIQRRHVLRVLTSVNGNKSRAARLLQVDRRTMRKLADVDAAGARTASASSRHAD